jgi:hypothetical protein
MRGDPPAAINMHWPSGGSASALCRQLKPRSLCRSRQTRLPLYSHNRFRPGSGCVPRNGSRAMRAMPSGGRAAIVRVIAVAPADSQLPMACVQPSCLRPWTAGQRQQHGQAQQCSFHPHSHHPCHDRSSLPHPHARSAETGAATECAPGLYRALAPCLAAGAPELPDVRGARRPPTSWLLQPKMAAKAIKPSINRAPAIHSSDRTIPMICPACVSPSPLGSIRPARISRRS